jgi:hypothetical protein
MHPLTPTWRMQMKIISPMNTKAHTGGKTYTA